MPHIVIISSSIRTGRLSHRVALYFSHFLTSKNLSSAEIIDLNQYQFPLFNERFKYQSNPAPEVVDFASRIKKADGVIIVTPEYNGGYPASLKNATDLLYEEWHRKPIAISTVSDGSFGGTQVITSLQFTLWKMRAWTVPAMFPVPSAQDAFDESGTLVNLSLEKRATNFVNELLWCVSAKSKMDGH
jgi:NAD(P)H-dependent FMN reductase